VKNAPHYQCHYCRKKFPIFGEYWGRVPQSEFLSTAKKLTMQGVGVDIGRIEKICYKCEEKMHARIKKIMNKKRQDRTEVKRWELKKMHKEANLDINIVFEEDEEKCASMVKASVEEQMRKKYGNERCDICGTRFDQFRGNLHKSTRLTLGTSILAKRYEFCDVCLDEIVEEIRAVIKK